VTQQLPVQAPAAALSRNNTLGKLFTPTCLCHQAVQLGTGESWGVPCDALASYRWSRSISWCLAEGYGNGDQSRPEAHVFLRTLCYYTSLVPAVWSSAPPIPRDVAERFRT